MREYEIKLCPTCKKKMVSFLGKNPDRDWKTWYQCVNMQCSFLVEQE